MTWIPNRDDQGNLEIRSSNVNFDPYLRVRHKGIMNTTINAGQSVDIDYKMEQLQYLAVNKPSYMTGVEFKVSGGNDGDNLDFCIIDIDNVLGYGANTVLDQFGDGYYIFPDKVSTIREHRADLIPNVYIRAHYNNVGASNATFICNLLRYMNTK